MKPRVSIILCTHDPRRDYLDATLEALRAQTLPADQWELLLVDNRSTPPLSETVDLSWHAAGTHLREEKLGLNNARLCGLRAAAGDVVVFVDDDNVLAPGYLATVLEIAAGWPMLGAWGCHISARYENSPPAWAEAFAHHLAVRTCSTPVWGSFMDDRCVPYGAGLCIRAEVGRAYLEQAGHDALCARLDRIGKGFGAAGDHDICHTAIHLGFGIGRFPTLRMTHLIGAARLRPEYFLKLVHGNARSALLLAMLRKTNPSYRATPLWPVMKCFAAWLRHRGMSRRILCAQASGELEAIRQVRRANLMEPSIS
jgi:glycosyltransferase involved in cell wall biosynthesis